MSITCREVAIAAGSYWVWRQNSCEAGESEVRWDCSEPGSTLYRSVIALLLVHESAWRDGLTSTGVSLFPACMRDHSNEHQGQTDIQSGKRRFLDRHCRWLSTWLVVHADRSLGRGEILGPACHILDLRAVCNMNFKIAVKIYKVENSFGDKFDYPRRAPPGSPHIHYMSIRWWILHSMVNWRHACIRLNDACTGPMLGFELDLSKEI